MTRVLAVDLGASSARVVAVDLPDDGAAPTYEVVHRIAHGPVHHDDGTLRWDWSRLVAEVERGLHHAVAVSAEPVASIGVDTWGVDYGLVDAAGQVIAPPFAYRDHRTDGWEELADRIGRDRLYAVTGIQLMAINTVFQLAAHDADELEAADGLLLLPELLVAALTGERTGERTSAGTSALVDLATGDWSDELLDAVGVDRRLFPELQPATTPVGSFLGIPVHLVGGHDTASAVAAVPGPPAPGAAFVSSGTWMLVGAERPAPDTSPAAAAANFSNEPGVMGGVRFLKNVMGMWLLEQCRAQWGGPPLEGLLAGAAAVGHDVPTFDATDHRFLAPADMEAEIKAAAGLPPSAGRDVVVRCLLASLAASTARVVAELESFLPGPVTELNVIGGAAQNLLLNELLAEASGVPVRVGPVEATAMGNALVQGVAIGRYRDLDEARSAL